MSSHGEMERKIALKLVVVHTRALQFKIIWNLIQENSEDNITNSQVHAEKRVLNTYIHTLDTIVLW